MKSIIRRILREDKINTQYKYMGKVLEQMIKGTKIDYERELIFPPISNNLTTHFEISFDNFYDNYHSYYYLFINMCKHMYGLADDEIHHIWKKYVNTIKNKITKG
jgi:hypothetical protein